MIPYCPTGPISRVLFQSNYCSAGFMTSIGFEMEFSPKTERFNRFFCLAEISMPGYIFRREIAESYPHVFRDAHPRHVDYELIKVEKGVAIVEFIGPAIEALRHATDPLAPPQPPEPVFIPMDITIGD